MRARVFVTPKAGILDPQGDAVQDSLQKLGFAVSGARLGRVIDLELESTDSEAARATVDDMCRRLLANPLIEQYEVEIVDG